MKQIELFFWGIVAAVGALFAEIIFSFISTIFENPQNFLSFQFATSSVLIVIVFVLIEEIFKYLIITKKVEPFSLEYSFFFNALLVGFGFALMEIALTIFQNKELLNDPFSLLQLGIVHMTTAGIMGYIAAIRKPHKFTTFFSSIFWASLVHLSYNLLKLNLNKFSYQDQIVAFLLLVMIFINIANLIRLPKKPH